MNEDPLYWRMEDLWVGPLNQKGNTDCEDNALSHHYQSRVLHCWSNLHCHKMLPRDLVLRMTMLPTLEAYALYTPTAEVNPFPLP